MFKMSKLKFRVNNVFVLVVFWLLVVGLVGVVCGSPNDIGRQYGFSDPEDLWIEDVTLGGDRLGKIIADEDAKIKYNYDGDTIEISDVEKGSWFKFDEGKLIEAEFTAKETKKYRIANLEFQVPEGGKVEFKDGDIVVMIPSGSVIDKKPSLVDSDKEAGIDEIKYVIDGGEVTLGGGDGVELGNLVNSDGNTEKTELIYDIYKEAFWVKKARVGKAVIGTLVLNYEIDGKKKTTRCDEGTYLLFGDYSGDLDSLGKPYVHFESKNHFVVGAPAGEESASVILLPGNEFGIDVEDGQEVILAAIPENGKKSVINVNKGDGRDIPIADTKGKYLIVSGDKAVNYIDKYVGTFGGGVKINGEEKESAALQIKSLTSEGEIITHEYEFDHEGKKYKQVTKHDFDIFVNKNSLNAEYPDSDSGKLRKSISFNEIGDKIVQDKLIALTWKTEEKQKELIGMSLTKLMQESPEKIAQRLGTLSPRQILGSGGDKLVAPRTSLTVSEVGGSGGEVDSTKWVDRRTSQDLKKFIEKSLGEGRVDNAHLKIDDEKGPMILFDRRWISPKNGIYYQYTHNSQDTLRIIEKELSGPSGATLATYIYCKTCNGGEWQKQ